MLFIFHNDFFLLSSNFSTTSLIGKVVDANNKQIPYAHITNLNNKNSTVSTA